LTRLTTDSKRGRSDREWSGQTT